jgi:hypothetical protein
VTTRIEYFSGFLMRVMQPLQKWRAYLSSWNDYNGDFWRFVLSHFLCTLLYSHLKRLRFFILLTFYTIGRTPWTNDQPIAKPLPTHRTAQTQNNCPKNSMSIVGFEPTIPVFERAKAVHDLNCAVTLIVKSVFWLIKFLCEIRVPFTDHSTSNLFSWSS